MAVAPAQAARWARVALDRYLRWRQPGYDYDLHFGGVFYLVGIPAPGHTPEEVEGLLLKELDRIKTEGVTDLELQKVKNQVQAGTYARMEDNGELRDQLAEAEGAGSYKDFLDEPARLAAVTREDVQRVARQYFVPENRNTMVIHRKEAK